MKFLFVSKSHFKESLFLLHSQTYSSDVLIAVNPFEDLPQYGSEQKNLYANGNLHENPPHVYAIGDYCLLINTYQNDL